MLAHITRDQILAAMQLFDADLRPSEPWAGWEQHQAHRWAIVHNAQRYPIKAIIARAAGVGVHTFSGGTVPADLYRMSGVSWPPIYPSPCVGSLHR